MPEYAQQFLRDKAAFNKVGAERLAAVLCVLSCVVCLHLPLAALHFSADGSPVGY